MVKRNNSILVVFFNVIDQITLGAPSSPLALTSTLYDQDGKKLDGPSPMTANATNNRYTALHKASTFSDLAVTAVTIEISDGDDLELRTQLLSVVEPILSIDQAAGCSC